MHYSKFAKVLGFSIILSSLSLGLAFADNSSVQKGIDEAIDLYQKRSATDSSPTDSAFTKLELLEKSTQDVGLKYKILILESRVLYWKGLHTDKNPEKIKIHGLGQKKADEAIQVHSEFAEGYYYGGIHLGRWAEANGVASSLKKKDILIDYMKQTLNHSTQENRPGETIDGYGPSRVLGWLNHKVPPILGGSRKEALKYLQQAYDNAKDFAINVVFLAEVLKGGNRTEKAEGKKILEQLLENDPNTYNLTRVPETLEEFEMARKLRDSL